MGARPSTVFVLTVRTCLWYNDGLQNRQCLYIDHNRCEWTPVIDPETDLYVSKPRVVLGGHLYQTQYIGSGSEYFTVLCYLITELLLL